MNTIINVLEEFEKLAYKFLLAIIFIPKTIVQVTVNPTWVPGYVKGELAQKESPFDENISPVILLLVVALLPAVVFNFLPDFDTAITGSPAYEESPNSRLYKFEAETNSISGSDRIYYEYTWYVERIEGVDGEGRLNYTEIPNSRVPHNEFDNRNLIIEYQNNNYRVSKDSYIYEFVDPGDYFVNVEVRKFDPFEEQDVEYYYDYIRVNVPADANKKISTVGENVKRGQTSEKPDLTKQITEESTIFLALALLFPPLFFALSTTLFKKGTEISESSLRESFYAQCYYFSPLSLAIWATYYAGAFYTSDVFFYWGDSIAAPAILTPSLLAIIWFIGVETQAVAQERGIRGWASFLIVMLCVTILGSVGYLVYLYTQPFSQIPEGVRILSILAYPVASILLIAGFVFVWFRRKRVDGKNVTRGEVITFITLSLVILGFMGLMYWAMLPTPAAPVEETSQAEPLPEVQVPTLEISSMAANEPPVESQPTQAATAAPSAQPFFTEQFDGNLDQWNPPFFTRGDQSVVDIVLVDGKLAFQLRQSDDKKPWVYLINNTASYENVQVEAVFTNNGNNTNGVSLICRYSENGWYEFMVSNSGFYEIGAYDSTGAVKAGYNLLFTGGSSAIKTGLATNTFSAVCNDSELTLFVNDVPVRTVIDNRFNFMNGLVGIAVSSPQGLPVNVEFDHVKVGEP